jgi:heptose-I-phosphate ethanolaminephosphotransferase
MGREARTPARVLLECLFWIPVWLVPIAARMHAGEGLPLRDIAVCVTVSAVLWYLGSHLGRFQLIYRIVLYVVLGLASLLATGMAVSDNGIINPLAMLAIVDTNTNEATEFAAGAFRLRDILLCLPLLLPGAVLFIQARRHLFLGPVRYAAAAIVALLVAQIGVKDVLAAAQSQGDAGEPATLASYFIYPVDRYPPLQPYIALASALAIRGKIAALARHSHPLDGVRAVEAPARKPRVYVIVVGESLARRHMHLYGYPRDTTPQLDKLAANGELYVYDNVVTPHALTVPALLSILRFRDGSGHDGHTAFDIFNGAGFKTYWVSNQYQYGAFESAVSLLSAAATEHDWLNQPMEQHRYEEQRNYDTVVLEPLKNIIQRDSSDKVIFIHLLGDHLKYRARFPESAAYFDGAAGSSCRTPRQNQFINDYDSSVRFNDTVISQIIATVQQADDESFVLYFSDHGEEIYDWRDFMDHLDSMISPNLAEIPLVLWLSDDYRKAHPAFVAHLGQTTHRPFITSNLMESMTDLARLSYPGMDDSRSLFSTQFTPHPRITADQDYDRMVANWAPDAAHANGVALLSCSDDHRNTTAAK